SGPRRGVEGVLVHADEAVDFVLVDRPDRVRAAGRLGHGALVPPHAPSVLMNLAHVAPDRIQCPHHDFRAAAETTPSGSSTRARPDLYPAHATDQAVHHQEPPDGLRSLGADNR